ncbi:MAG: hypothetical protein AB7O32_15795 [Vicinamibacterales bacterium]
MPSSTLAILAAGVLVVLAAVLLWRGGRRGDEGYLKNAAVSRQWLIEHQSEDRS